MTAPANMQCDGRAAPQSAEPPLIIPGDLCAPAGPVEAKHDVIVRGNVADGMILKAGGSAQIDGVIEAAQVRVEKHLRASGGISGRGKGICTAAVGGVLTKYIWNASVEAAGHVIVSGDIDNSRVTCRGKLQVEGTILASHVAAVAGVRCAT